jgi:uncharacterized membrane protein
MPAAFGLTSASNQHDRSSSIMSVDVTTTIVIERPIAEVAGYSGDPSNAPEWNRRIASAEWQTEPPMMLGSQITFTARFMGKDLVYTYEVIEYTPQDQVAMRTTQGPFPINTTYTWRAVGERVTHMTLRNHGEPTGFWRLAAPLITIAMRRAVPHDLSRLKQLLESRR